MNKVFEVPLDREIEMEEAFKAGWFAAVEFCDPHSALIGEYYEHAMDETLENYQAVQNCCGQD